MTQKHSNKTTFSNILYCGSCGQPFIRRTLTSTRKNIKYLYPAWKCRVADGRRKDMECHAHSYREEAMEHAFMTMLLEMKLEQGRLVKESEVAIEEKNLDAWEKERMNFLKTEIESLNERLCDVAASARKSTARDVYDDMSLDLTQELEVLQKEWEQLNQKKSEAYTLRGTLEWLIKELDNIQDFDPSSERINFREDIFRRIVQRGDAYDDGSIIYELVFGITRKASGNGDAVWKYSD